MEVSSYIYNFRQDDLNDTKDILHNEARIDRNYQVSSNAHHSEVVPNYYILLQKPEEDAKKNYILHDIEVISVSVDVSIEDNLSLNFDNIFKIRNLKNVNEVLKIETEVVQNPINQTPIGNTINIFSHVYYPLLNIRGNQTTNYGLVFRFSDIYFPRVDIYT